MKRTVLFLLFVACVWWGKAQINCYRVYIHDKANTPYSVAQPQQFLSERAIAKRARFNIAITEEDFPVNPAYLQSIRQTGGDVLVMATSRWFNTATVRCPDSAALAAISQLDFVDSVVAVGYLADVSEQSEAPEIRLEDTEVLEPETDSLQYGRGMAQIAVHNGHLLHNEGFKGEGMLITMLDAGWLAFDRNPYFANLYENGQILGTYNFIPGQSDVYWGHSHGAACASIILSNVSRRVGSSYETFVGTAPNASAFFVRTEHGEFEELMEEDFWVAGAELADSLGTDVLSSSLGYTGFDYPEIASSHSTLDGRSSLASLAATKAAHKGMVVCIAAGNEGYNEWHRISRPSDAEDVLAVGAVSVDSIPAPFTGVGPSFDGRVKPDVASVGDMTTYVSAECYGFTHWETGEDTMFVFTDVSNGSGTSFATPCLAGLAACLWQALPQYNSLEITQMIREAGHIFNAPDTLMGYGIPDFYRTYLAHRDTTGIHANQLLQDVVAFPNPCHNQLTVSNLSLSIKEYAVFDMSGRVVASGALSAEGVVAVNTARWPSGLYLLMAKGAKGWSEAIKIVKQ